MIAFGKVIPLLLAYSVEKLPKILNFLVQFVYLLIIAQH